MSRQKMTTDSAPAYTHLRYYKNLTKKGNPTAMKAARTIHYHAYGAGPRAEEEPLELRGQWYRPDGEMVSHSEVMAWGQAQAKAHKYTYTAVLSVRDGRMDAADFTQAMQQAGVFADWRMIKHSDTEHDHAHVVMFRDKTLSKAEFNRWRKGVRAELEQLEALRLQAEARQQLGRGLEL